MKRTVIHFIALFALTYVTCSCEHDSISKSHDDVFKAEVLGKGTDCNVCLLKFTEKTSNLKKLYGSSINNTYYALNYPNSMIKKGMTVKVKIREVASHEIPACLTYGPAYSSLIILEVNE